MYLDSGSLQLRALLCRVSPSRDRVAQKGEVKQNPTGVNETHKMGKYVYLTGLECTPSALWKMDV